jgi:hypothetical protein
MHFLYFPGRLIAFKVVYRVIFNALEVVVCGGNLSIGGLSRPPEAPGGNRTRASLDKLMRNYGNHRQAFPPGHGW